MGTLTFLEWLRKQVRAEGWENFTDGDVEMRINAMSNFALLQYFADYQQETQK